MTNFNVCTTLFLNSVGKPVTGVRKADISDNYTLYHYDNNNIVMTNPLRKVKGIIVDNTTGNIVCRSNSETPMFLSNKIDNFNFPDDLKDVHCFRSKDITVIRAFYDTYDKKWMFT